MTDRTTDERRVLLLAPTRQDATTSRTLLADAGVGCLPCRDVDEVCGHLAAGAGAVVLAEEVILHGRGRGLARLLERQPAWSSVPVIVLVAAGPDSAVKVRAILELGDVMLLKRPLAVETFVNAVRAALRDRERQYQVRDHLAVRAKVEAVLREQEELLRDADRKKDDFIALLAHELRNPLAPLQNGLQVMRLAGGDLDTVARTRALMERQLAHLVRLVDDLLDVSRISRNKMELRRTRVLLADAMGGAVELARPLIDAARHDLQLSLPPGPVFLDADEMRLAQVFANLLTNSAKYTDPGGRIRFAASLVQKEEGERRKEEPSPPDSSFILHPSSFQEVVVTVRDNGIGIPADALDRIFDMFSQVDRPSERDTGGLGIGLALVKGLVEMHGGTVVADSGGPGLGSTFTVRLPVAAAGPAPVAEPADDRRRPGRRVLVVDDNRDGANSLALLLRYLGHEVLTAHDGLEAVEAAGRFRPQVILMDVGMPRLDGLEATRRIREQCWGKGILIVALTGWGQEQDREETRQAGCDAHLVKPIHLASLEKLLAEAAR